MTSFYVLNWCFNHDTVEYYDIMPYLMDRYKNIKPKKNRPNTFESVKEFVKDESLRQWWSRCEYEIIVTGFPVQKNEVKLDVYTQINMNLDIITRTLMDNLKIK